MENNHHDFLDTLREIEGKWQQRWYEEEIFVPEINRDKEKFFFTVAYPYTNAPLHVGHSRTYTLGDIIARFKRLQGYNVLWPMAWHITGTPILAIANRIARGDPEIINLYREYIQIYETDRDQIDEILNSFTDPVIIANYFASKIAEDFKRIGLSIDFTRQFTTGEDTYHQFVSWQFKQLNEKGYINKTSYPVLYCRQDENAVGEDDISGGDETKFEVSEMTLVKFQLEETERGRPTYMVCATLRPETIFGITNLWINPSTEYVRIKHVNEESEWIISANAAIKMEEQNREIKRIGEVSADKLIEQYVKVPIAKKSVPVLPASFIDDQYGTGLVYSVPAHSVKDYIGLQELKKGKDNDTTDFDLKQVVDSLKIISIVETTKDYMIPAQKLVEIHGIADFSDIDAVNAAEKELYKEEYFKGSLIESIPKCGGKQIAEANDIMKEYFANRNGVFYEVSAPATCRCGGQVIVAIISDQYFLNYNAGNWKDEAFQYLNQMTISPAKYRSLFEKTFDWLEMRPCARKRGIGTKLPFGESDWIIESLSDSTIYMAFYTIIKQIRKYGITADQLIPEVFDFIFHEKGNISEVAKYSGIDKDKLITIQKEFQYWYPNDVRHTAIGHISNHLSFAIFHHVAIFPDQPIQTYSLNEMLNKDGVAMSKSKGNVIPIAEIPDKYSVDLTRLYLAISTSADTIVNFRDDEIQAYQQQLQHFWNIVIQTIENCEEINYDIPSIYAKSFLINAYSQIRAGIKAVTEMQFRDYGNHVFHNMIGLIRKFSGKVKDQEIYNTLIRILPIWLQILSPVIPHIAEQMWEELGNEQYISLSNIPAVEELYHDNPNTDMMFIRYEQYIENVQSDIKNIIDLNDIDPSKIHIYIAPEWKFKLYQYLHKLETGHITVGFVMNELSQMKKFQPHLKQINSQLSIFIDQFRSVNPKQGQKFEINAMSKFVSIIENRFNTSVIFHTSDTMDGTDDPTGKSLKALPGRPAIFME